MIYRISSSRANHKDPDEHEYPHPTNPTASFGLIYTDAVPVVPWWWRAVCRHSRAVSPLLTCPAPRDCRLTLRICVACWVSDDLDAWPACARRTVVASVNVIVVTVLDRCPLWPNVLLFLNLHCTTTTPPKTATRSPDITTPPPPTNNTQRPPSSLSFPLDTPTSLPPLLLTSVIYCPRAHLEE